MRNSGWLPMAAFVLIPLCASADEPSKPAPAVVLPSNDHALSRVHAGLTADVAKASGPQRDVSMTTGQPAAKQPVERPAPTPRMLRKMATDRAVAGIDPAVRACAVGNPTTAPLSLTMRVVVAPNGVVERTDLAAGATAPSAVVACVSAAVSTARFGPPGPNGATIALPITVPARPPGVPAPTRPARPAATTKAG